MPHSKTPGGQAASEKFQKKEAAAQGLGAPNAPAHKESGKPGDALVAGDSYTSTVGVEAGTNQPGESGNVNASGKVGDMGEAKINQGNMK